MDKHRGVKRRAKHSGQRKGVFESAVKSKKEKVRSLSSVGRALSSCEHNKMGYHAFNNNKRFKISKRVLDDENGVGHASVPRKLRSAVKKRNLEYSILISEKVSYDELSLMESPIKGGVMKSKGSMQQGDPDWSTRQIVSGPITKDEEEVVETLYSLAGMFLNNVSNVRHTLEGDSSPENSNVKDLENSTNDAFEGAGIAQDSHPLNGERSSGEATITYSSIDSIDDRKQPDFIEDAELMTSDNFTPKLNMDTMPMLIKNVNGNEAALDDSELSLAVGSSMSRQSQNSFNERNPEMTEAVESEQVHHMMNDQNKNGGPTLWPGLARAASARGQASCLQSSAVKAPVLPDASVSASKQDSTQGGSSSEISEVVVHKRLWKRCAAHVHICKFIRSQQVPNNKDALQQASNSNQLITSKSANEGSMHEDLMEGRSSNGARSGIVSAPGPGHSHTTKDLHDNKKSNLQHSRSYNEALTLDMYGPQKQELDLFSLSAGGNRMKVNNGNGFDKSGGSRLDSLPKLQMPYFQPLVQMQGLMAFPVPQNQYASSSYLTHKISAAGPQVLPHYYGNPLCVGRDSLMASNNKHLQQSFWAMQVAAQGQGKSGVNCIMRPLYPKWESGVQDLVVNPAMIPQSSAPVQVLGSKFASISEQHQQQQYTFPSLHHYHNPGLMG